MKEFELSDSMIEQINKANEANNRVQEAIKPMLETQEKVKQATEYIGNIPEYKNPISTAFAEAIRPAQIMCSNLPMYLLSSDIANTLGSTIANIKNTVAYELFEQTRSVLSQLHLQIETIARSPIINFIQSIDSRPLANIFEGIDLSYFDEFDELNEQYLQAMYDAKWFPYIASNADLSLFDEILDILSTSRGMSKRCEKRIDNAIFSYYDTQEIKCIKRQWKQSDDLPPHIKKALGQALDAYLRKEYALTISFLATLWEGFIREKAKVAKETRGEKVKKLFDENGYESFYSDFYSNFIFAPCYKDDEVIDGIPNRNGLFHSRFPKYPTQKSALNAIILTDFLINLKPIPNSEDK